MEKAFLINISLEGKGKNNKEELLELKELAKTAGAISISYSLQNRNKPDPATFIGKGKLESILNQAKELECYLIIFNNELSPTHLKNIQKTAGEEIKIIDRTGLILDIFTHHAKTKEAKTQVALAQSEYLLPRLTRQWTHLERQMGGIGTRAGAGETQIEVDRRLLRNRINKLKIELKEIQKQRKTQNANRVHAYRISLVGYTNAGKSTLMEKLTNSDVFIEDKLFATLDTTTRKMDIKSGIPVLLSDTVGFIKNLPHNLVASFRSTLGEIKEVNLLLKIFDASSNNLHIHIDTVNEVLNNLEVFNKPSITIFNKIDLIADKYQLNGLKKRYPDSIFTSALTNIGTNIINKKINNIIKSNFLRETFNIPYKHSKLIDVIYKLTHVIKKKEDYNGMIIEVEGNKEAIDKIKKMLINE